MSFEISEIGSDLEFISARVADGEGRITVTFSGDAAEGKFRGSLTIETTSGSELIVPIRGDVSP